MEELFFFHKSMLGSIKDDFFRFKYEKINWSQRMVAIRGPRGSGKTTLMLQHLKFHLGNTSQALYVTADHPYFYNHTLLEMATDFIKNGGRYLFIDEVHKYPNWSRELKNIYDGFPELQTVFSASSALDIYRGEADISRRVMIYDLPGMSFREFLSFAHGIQLEPVTWEDLIKDHKDIAMQVSQQFHPLPYFKEYLKWGYLPIGFYESKEDYWFRLNNTINAVIDFDLAYIEHYATSSAIKVKRLLGVISESVPFKPNIASLARKLNLSRDSVYLYLKHLIDARLLNALTAEGKGMGKMQKPDKLLLENTNLAYALNFNPDYGSLRECFFVNQVLNNHLPVYYPLKGDVKVKDHIVEIGGKSKSGSQVKDEENAIIAADDIEVGFSQKIPLWLFGMMY